MLIFCTRKAILLSIELTSKLDNKIGIDIKNNIHSGYVAPRNGSSGAISSGFMRSDDSRNRLLKSISPVVIDITFKCARHPVENGERYNFKNQTSLIYIHKFSITYFIFQTWYMEYHIKSQRICNH